MASEMNHIDPYTATIIVCVMFGFVFTIFIFVMCKYYIKKKKRNVDAVFQRSPVVVTSTTHTVPSGYTVTQIPAGATTTAYQTQSYTTPYPTQGAPVHMPMPMPMPMPTGQPSVPGVHTNVPPYPTMGTTTMNPPPYDVAVSGAGAGQPNNSIYEKQLAYNPHYQM